MDDTHTDVPPSEFLQSIQRLTRDLRNASITLSDREARFLVDSYYSMQRDRIRAAHQNRTLAANAEPHDVLLWLQGQRDTLEKQIARALDAYSDGLVVGRWARSQVGIGPIIAAGLAANIDIKQAPTVGHIWRFAGLDPTVKWERNTKRPWNGSLKRLCFLIGESFVKVSNNENAVYGHAYAVRKRREIESNDKGMYAEQAIAALVAKKFGDDTQAKQWYDGCYPGGTMGRMMLLDTAKREAFLKKVKVKAGKGTQMLPPARIHLRACRWATKLFLSGYHHVAYETHHGVAPPFPFILAKDPELHTTFMKPPNWPMME